MNRSTALSVFDLPEGKLDQDDLLDACEKAVFDIAGYFLRNHPHPALIQGKIKKLLTFSEAFLALGGNETLGSIAGVGPLKGTPLEVIRSYETQLSGLRTLLSGATLPEAAITVLQRMAELQSLWDTWFYTCFEFLRNPAQASVPAKFPDTAQMIRLLNEVGNSTNKTLESLSLEKPFLEEFARLERQLNQSRNGR